MFRREFLNSLGILPFFSFLKPKNKENPNNLPVAKFDENKRLSNIAELLFGEEKALVFINRENFVLWATEKLFYGEALLKNMSDIYALYPTDKSIFIRPCISWVPKSYCANKPCVTQNHLDNPCSMLVLTENGEWVKYKDLKPMLSKIRTFT